MEVKTLELKRCIEIMGYWINENESSIQTLLSKETDIVKDYVLPFKDELNKNLLNNGTLDAQKTILKHYIYELQFLALFFDYNNDVLFEKSDKDESERQRSLDEVSTDYEKYVIECYELSNMLYCEIQISCIKYTIDFFKLCNELDVSMMHFDSSPTLAYTESKENNEIENTQNIDIDFDTNKELKICFLYDLGVIDYLQNKHFSNNQIAEIIEYLTKTPIKTGVTNKTVSNIQNRIFDITDKYEKQLATLRLRFKIR